MEFYAVDDKDPVIRSWMRIFPELFHEKGEMSEKLWAHARYPGDFFEVQTDVYCTYHMTDTNTYYNREDVWEVTPNGRERRIEPNYVTMRLWGEEAAEFAIIVPYMPLGRDNLIGWMAGTLRPRQVRRAARLRIPEAEADLRPGAGRGAHRPEPGDFRAAFALEPARLGRHTRRPARHTDREVAALRAAALPQGRDGRTAGA